MCSSCSQNWFLDRTHISSTAHTNTYYFFIFIIIIIILCSLYTHASRNSDLYSQPPGAYTYKYYTCAYARISRGKRIVYTVTHDGNNIIQYILRIFLLPPTPFFSNKSYCTTFIIYIPTMVFFSRTVRTYILCMVAETTGQNRKQRHGAHTIVKYHLSASRVKKIKNIENIIFCKLFTHNE